MADRKLVSGPGYSGPAQPPSREEQAIAAEEASSPSVRPGQDRANQFFKDVANDGLADSGIPEAIFRGASVDPEDIVGGEKKFIGRSGMRERFGTDMAISRVGPELAKKMNIDLSTHVPKWYYQNHYAGSDRNHEDEWIADNPDGEVCLDKDGKKHHMLGLTLMKLPIPVQREIEADLNEEVQLANAKASTSNPDLPDDNASLKKMRDENAAAINALLRGSMSEKMLIDTATERFTPEETAKISDQFRYAFSARRSTDRENAIDKAVETATTVSSGRKTFAMGAGLENGRVVRA